MSTFFQPLINAKNIKIEDIDKLFNKLKKKELKSFLEYHEYIKKKYYLDYPDDNARKYEIIYSYDFDESEIKELEYEIRPKENIKQSFEKLQELSIYSRYESIYFFHNFFFISFSFGNLPFLCFKALRDIVRNITRELAKELKGTSAIYVNEYHYIFDFVYPSYIEQLQSMDEVLIKLQERKAKEIPMENYYDYFEGPYPSVNDYFFEKFT